MKVVGIEAANSFVKIKSALGESSYLNTVREHFDGEEEFIPTGDKGETRFKYDGHTYSVGTIFDYTSSSARDSDKYATPQYKLENLLGIAQHVRNGDEIRVVTGVPSEHYSEETIETIKNQLLGAHTVHVDGDPRTFDIKDVRVILQPLGTLTHLLVDEKGDIRSEGRLLTRADRRTVIVDIGWGTTDIAIMEGTNLVKYFSIEPAMQDAYESILARVGLTSKITPFQAEYQLKQDDIITYGGVTYPARAIKEDAFENNAQAIISKLKNRLKLETYDAVIFTGGGVSALYDYIREVALSIPNSVPIKDPQMANARGYYAYGLARGRL